MSEETENKEIETTQDTATETDAETEAQDAFKAGFAKAAGEPLDSSTDAQPEPEPESEPAAEDTPAAEPEPEKETAEQKTPDPEPVESESPSATEARLRKLESRIGNLFDSVQKMRTQDAPSDSKGESPSQKQVNAALRDPDKMKELIDEFPSFEPMMSEIKALREDMSGLWNRDAIVKEATEAALTNFENRQLMKEYPNWVDDARKPEFKRWSLIGGPSETDWTRMETVTQYNQEEANSMIDRWSHEHPEWWQSKGKFLFSTRPSDTLHVMSSYRDASSEANKHIGTIAGAAKKAQQSARNKDRLSKAVSPDGTSEAPTTGISDEEAFKAGFNRAIRR